jgi:SH3-like domain-containing protein
MYRRDVLFSCLATLPAVWVGTAWAQDPAGQAGARQVERPGRTGLPLPRFVSLRAAEVNLRTGPGVRYPIDWVYQRRGLPVEVIDEFETWRRIRDHEGTTGWVHQSMLDGRRSLMVAGEARLLRRTPEPGAPGVARLEAGVIGRLEGCEGDWCRVTVERFAGWLRRGEVFGLYPGETVP